MSRDKTTPTGQGYNFMGHRADVIQRNLAALTAANARRIPCKICGLRVLPENMPRHLALCTEGD